MTTQECGTINRTSQGYLSVSLSQFSVPAYSALTTCRPSMLSLAISYNLVSLLLHQPTPIAYTTSPPFSTFTFYSTKDTPPRQILRILPHRPPLPSSQTHPPNPFSKARAIHQSPPVSPHPLTLNRSSTLSHVSTYRPPIEPFPFPTP